MAKKAVLIGITYQGADNELKGCGTDVWRMHQCLVDRLGFSPDDINVLLDTDPSYTQPTGQNVCDSLNQLVASAETGDFLFVLYSGHGARLPVDENDTEDSTGFDECIVTSDNIFITDDFFKSLVCLVPEGCKLTMLSDSCHSGGLISSAEEQIGESTIGRRVEEEEKEEEKEEETGLATSDALEASTGTRVVDEGCELKSKSLSLSDVVQILRKKTGNEDIDEGNLRPSISELYRETQKATPKLKKFADMILDQVRKSKEPLPENGILMSGCQSHQTSVDYRNQTEEGELIAFGAFTNAVLTIIEDCGGEISNKELVVKARELLESQGFDQRPGLYCSEQYADAPFVC